MQRTRTCRCKSAPSTRTGLRECLGHSKARLSGRPYQLSRQELLETLGAHDQTDLLDLPGDLLHGLELLQAKQDRVVCPWWLLRPIRLLLPRVNRVMPQSDNHDEAPRAPEAQRLEHSERVICAQTAREHVARYLDADAPC